MTLDEIIRMARDVGAGEPDSLYGRTDYVAMTKHEIERFAALVAAAEREECAKVCEQTDEDGEGPDCWGWHAKDYARAIRARGQ